MVKRYSFDLMDTHTGSGDLRERRDGEWVCHADYAALESRLATLEATLANAKARIETVAFGQARITTGALLAIANEIRDALRKDTPR